jgi:hypothetical protein
MTRNIPLRERKPKKKIEDDEAARVQLEAAFPAPSGDPAFQDGYRECISMFAINAPNKKGVGRLLDEHCMNLENACMSNPTRANYAAYEGYRQAIKDLKKAKRMR